MDILSYNASWMTFNLLLAVLPVLVSFLLFRIRNTVAAVVVVLVWLLLLPNSMYVITDVIHMIRQWGQIEGIGRVILILQYVIFEFIGLLCFLIAFYPMEKMLTQWGLAGKQLLFGLIGMNFLVGFALVLGRFERVNSWDVILNPMFVVTSTIQTLTSYQMLGLIILFGLFSNFFYFLFRDRAKKLYTKIIR